MDSFMRNFSLLLSVASILVFSANAFAAGDAGCGLGSIVFTKNSKALQILAMTTNGTFSSQMFGITTGTSNCSSNGFAQVNKEQVIFAESNFQNLQVEMARGQGESLQGLAQIMGCSENAAAAFGTMTKSKYETIIPSSKTSAVEMLQSIKQEMATDPVLAKECLKVS